MSNGSYWYREEKISISGGLIEISLDRKGGQMDVLVTDNAGVAMDRQKTYLGDVDNLYGELILELNKCKTGYQILENGRR